MANYKEILGKKFKDGMTADEVLALLEKVDLGNLADGSYVAKGEYDAKDGEIVKLQKELKAYKDKEKASLSDEEKTRYELERLTESQELLKQELEKYKLKDAIMQNGFSEEECEKIMHAQSNNENVSAVYAAIIKERTEAAVQSVKAEMTQKGTPNAPTGSAEIMGTANEEKSPDVALAEEIARANMVDTRSLGNIKDAYTLGGDKE